MAHNVEQIASSTCPAFRWNAKYMDLSSSVYRSSDRSVAQARAPGRQRLSQSSSGTVRHATQNLPSRKNHNEAPSAIAAHSHFWVTDVPELQRG
eukprot:CAMPEP_0182834350 /NCGR_PEP_ID=MMETSP0006_2-20121128/20865_1 /TAXON_ID=97485 /ORGANISM="Prymnesium parvum, Strain Texoma1" /LENGTH=93 /DNA_ID=CAMNT_0024962585 /DNA_START=364 /DNA_END=645 /DNA_ORIENTATION=-